jgi:hypothetical protein
MTRSRIYSKVTTLYLNIKYKKKIEETCKMNLGYHIWGCRNLYILGSFVEMVKVSDRQFWVRSVIIYLYELYV